MKGSTDLLVRITKFSDSNASIGGKNSAYYNRVQFIGFPKRYLHSINYRISASHFVGR